MKNPNRKVKLEELEDKLGESLRKDIHKILENLGFTKERRELFFDVSKRTILFRNPITEKDLKELGISRLSIPKD